MSEAVNHPSHYGGDVPYEVVKVNEAWGFDSNHDIASAIEYIARHDKKGTPEQDLRKAVWWIKRHIKKLRKKRHADKRTKT